MNTMILLTGILFAGAINGAAGQPEPPAISTGTGTSHETVEACNQAATEPLFDFPISRALGIRTESKPKSDGERQVEAERIFSFYIASAR